MERNIKLMHALMREKRLPIENGLFFELFGELVNENFINHSIAKFESVLFFKGLNERFWLLNNLGFKVFIQN